MLFGSFTGVVVVGNHIALSVPSNQDGIKTDIIVEAFGGLETTLKGLKGKNATVTGILLRDKETRSLVLQAQSAVQAQKEYTPKSFAVSAVVTATEIKLSGSEKTTVTLSAYSTNPGRDSGFTGLNVKFYNPTNKMIELLQSIAAEDNKTQLYTVGNLDFYVGEASEGGTYTVVSLWNRQFELLRGAPTKGGYAGKKNTSPATTAVADDDDF